MLKKNCRGNADNTCGKQECSVRSFSDTRTLHASSSILTSDLTLLVSQTTAVPETSFYLTFSRDSPSGWRHGAARRSWERRFSGHEETFLWWSQQGVNVTTVVGVVLR